MNKPFFSVIIPVFNSEKYIKKCIESALEQSFEGGFEIIAVNDGSTDKTGDILREFNNIKIFENENKGPAFSRNFGIEKAEGEYIVFLDADDYLEKDALLNFYKGAKKGADIVTGTYYAIREQRHDIKFYDPLKKVSKEGFLNLQNTNGEILKANFEPWAKAYRREYLLQNDIKFPNFFLAEDFPFYYSAILNTEKIIALKEPVYRYRRGHKPAQKGEKFDPVFEVKEAILEADRLVKSFKDYKKIEKIHKKNIMMAVLYWLRIFRELENRDELFEFGKEFLADSGLLREFCFRKFILELFLRAKLNW